MGLFDMFRSNKNAPKATKQPEKEALYATGEPSKDAEDTLAAVLLASPYYAKYDNLFQFIIHSGKQEQYKIDLLLESLKMGRDLELDGYYVKASIQKNLPYFCETEQEFDMFFKSEKPVLRGSVDGILEMISFYLYSEKHPSKQKYWQQHLLDIAQNGNLEAQAALCTNLVRSIFSEQELATFKKAYETNLMQLAEAGNGMAQLAVGEFLASRPPFKIEWLTKAAQQGLSDAWYQLGRAYSSMINITEDGQFKPNRLSEDEVHQLMVKESECFLCGARANNGIMAAWCQYKTGDRYTEGRLLPKDLTQAAYWLQEALKNGEEMARGHLEYVEKLMSEQ